jgi:hypothetical protein
MRPVVATSLRRLALSERIDDDDTFDFLAVAMSSEWSSRHPRARAAAIMAYVCPIPATAKIFIVHAATSVS